MKIEAIRTAQKHVDNVLASVVPSLLTAGISEKEASGKLTNALLAEGSFELAFPNIVAFGAGAAEPHHTPQKDRYLQEGDPILIDCGVTFDGWCTDVTRMFSLGEPSRMFREKYEKVLRIHEAVLSLFVAGANVAELDQFVRQRLGADEKYFIHGLGHGVGKEVHEEPRITSKTQSPGIKILEEGMIVTCEPGLYYPKKFGIRIEDILLVQRKEPEILSQTSRDLCVLKHY